MHYFILLAQLKLRLGGMVGEKAAMMTSPCDDLAFRQLFNFELQ
jgi:hypothetical protein